MKVKIGDTWYDSDEEPICILVNEFEQEQIANLDRSSGLQGKLGSFPAGQLSRDQMLEWMEVDTGSDILRAPAINDSTGD